MSKRRSKYPDCYAIYHVWDSPAIRDSYAVSRVIFLKIIRRFNGFNNGKISLSV